MKTILRPFIAFWIWVTSDDEERMLDHVPVNKTEDGQSMDGRIAKARAAAKRRHGRKFLCDTNIERATPPSHDLMEIMTKTMPEKTKGSAVATFDLRRSAQR